MSGDTEMSRRQGGADERNREDRDGLNQLEATATSGARGSSAVARRIYDAFERDDLPAVLAELEEAIEWRLAEGHPYSPRGEAWVGHAAIVENFFARAGADWDRFHVAFTDLHDAGAAVVAEVRYSGIFKHTGRTLDAQGCHVWKLRRGKAASFQQYVDTSQLHAVMGTVPPRKEPL